MRYLILLLVACGGCLIVPKDTTTGRVIGQGVEEHEGERGELTLYVAEADRKVIVRLLAPRMCTAESYAVVEETHHTTAGIASAGGTSIRVPANPLEAMAVGGVVALFELVALPISGVVTAATVANSDDSKTQARRTTATRKHACPVPGAHLVVELQLPSGGKLIGQTDERGHAVFELSAGEPEIGVVTVRADHVAPRSLLLKARG